MTAHFWPGPYDDHRNRCIDCGAYQDERGNDLDLCSRDRCAECCDANDCHVVCTECEQAVDPLAACEHRLCVDCGECGHGEHGGCAECGACTECDEDRAIDRAVAAQERERGRDEYLAECAADAERDRQWERDRAIGGAA